ncbi:MAG: hypothetical protein JWM55_1720 [Acidimicrobiaceae bacterium]|nr:hypothetical protein [Acidimicrobiaceae bacterium]
MSPRRLIVNADDLGQSPSINAGIERAVREGVVTSASLMVRWPAAEAAAQWAADNPHVSVGLHLDLGEWSYSEGEWSEKYRFADPEDGDAVHDELVTQLETFERLLGRAPTHLDSHQHVHRNEPLRSFVLEGARRLDVPLREEFGPVSYCGSFYGQSGRGDPYPDGVTLAAFLAILDALPEGTSEIGCHPGSDPSDLDSMYRFERSLELEVLCDEGLHDELRRRGIELCSYHDVAGMMLEPDHSENL